MQNIKELIISGLGDIFAKDNLSRTLDALNFDHYKNITLVLFSNGIAFDKEKRKELFSRCPSFRIYFSIEAATPETYYKLRRVNCFHKVLRNVIESVKDPQRNVNKQKISVTYTINTINVDEVEGMTRTWTNIPVDEILFSSTHNSYAAIDDPVNNIIVNEHNYKRFVRARKIITRLEQESFPVLITNPLEKDYEIKNRQQITAL